MRARRAFFEPLEARLQLATITVTSLADDLDVDQQITLREALQAANTDTSVDGSPAGNGADTIVFQPGLTGAILLAQGQLEITAPLTLTGPAKGVLVINAQGASRVLNIQQSSGDVILEHLTITGGTTRGQAGVDNPTLSGGGIRFLSPGRLTLSSVRVLRNSTSGGRAAGGGIFALSGDVVVEDSEVSGNGTDGREAHGGGIAATGGDVVVVTSTISGNTTTGERAYGGGLTTEFGALTISNSTVSGNRTDGSGSSGGGIFARFGNITLNQSTVSGNRTDGAAAHGGGIYAKYTRDLTISSSTISGNGTVDQNARGGGIFKFASSSNSWLSIANSIVAANYEAAGGADFVPDAIGGILEVSHSLIGTNANTGLSPAPPGSPDANGNLIGTLGNRINPKLGPLGFHGGPTQTQVLLEDSPAIDAGDPDAFLDLDDNSQFDQRGAPFLRIANARIDIGAYERQAFDPPMFVVTTTADELDYGNNDVSLREAINTANGNENSPTADTITFSSALSQSGVSTINLVLGELTVAESLTIVGPNHASLTIDAQQLSRVLNVLEDAGDVSLENLSFTRGKTELDNEFLLEGGLENTQSGGGIRFASLGTLTLINVEVSGSETRGARARGGAIFTVSGQLILTDNSTVSGNRTTGKDSHGGGIYARSDLVTLTNSRVSENSTSGEDAAGGGIYSRFGRVVLTKSTISGNSSASRGGGILAEFTSGTFYSRSVKIINSTLSGNMASQSGGGIYTDASSVEVSDSTISGNEASGNGGGIAANSKIVNVSNSTIFENSSSNSGGGIFIRDTFDDANLTLVNSILAANMATDNGPNSFMGSGGMLHISHSLIGDNSGTGLSEAQTPDASGNLIGTSANTIDPQLGPLRNNGGPTETHALIPDSPAIDAGDPNFDSVETPFDQRGLAFARVADGDRDKTARVDMGAFELSFDFGDAPEHYPVTLAQGGPVHAIRGPRLGSEIDAELDGQPSADATGEGADDDGVLITASIVALSGTVATASVAVEASAIGKLDAWIDFNQDGDWLDAGEQVFTSQEVAAGPNVLSFQVPAGATPGETFARFRLSSAGGLAPTGEAADGEVEDYQVTIFDGEATSGAAVEVQSPTPGTLDVVADGGDVVVRRGAVELFRAPGSSLNRLHIVGTDGDDTLNIANLDAIFAGLISADAGAGYDKLRLTGGGQELDLTQINDGDLQGLEEIDLTGSGDNTLVLNAEDVRNLSPTTDTLLVRIDAGDSVAFGPGWTTDAPTLIDGETVHQQQQDTAILQVVSDRPFQNPFFPLDTNRDGTVSPLDVLLPINTMMALGARPLLTPTTVAELPEFYFDTNGDAFVSAIDALLPINFLMNAGSSPEGESVIWDMPATAAYDEVWLSASARSLDVEWNGSTPETDVVWKPLPKLPVENYEFREQLGSPLGQPPMRAQSQRSTPRPGEVNVEHVSSVLGTLEACPMHGNG